MFTIVQQRSGVCNIWPVGQIWPTEAGDIRGTLVAGGFTGVVMGAWPVPAPVIGSRELHHGCSQESGKSGNRKKPQWQLASL